MKNDRSIVWKSLNSPFVIFLLSTVLVTGLSKHLESRQAAREIARQSNKYLFECIYRINIVLRSLPLDAEITLWDLPELAIKGERNGFKSLFKEFEDHTTTGLLAYLSLRYPEKKRQFDEIRDSLEEMLVFLSVPVQTERKEKSLSGGRKIVLHVYHITSEQRKTLKALRERLKYHVSVLETFIKHC